jgi:transcription initiation factor TFIIIB Brf1 subunit/transcription initiation factor TFIIB
MDERYKRSDSQLNTMKKKYTAYFAKKLPLPGTSKSYRTQEDIASYIRVTPNTIKSYISEITDIAVYKKGIEDRINELRNTREKIILGLI